MIVFAVLAPLAISAAAERPAVVLVTDCGASIDDQFALVHLAISPEIELRGVISTLSPNLPPPFAESSAKAAREVLGWLDRKDTPPVVAGSSAPISGPSPPKPGAAVDFLIAESRRLPAGRRLHVLVIGTMTDVALALRVDPTLADRVEVVAMGFDDAKLGGDAWNVKNDVGAWREVLRSKVPIVVGDDATTRPRLRLTVEEAKDRFRGEDRASRSLVGAFSGWVGDHPGPARALTGRADAFPIWDEVVVAHLLGLTASETRPRPGLRDDLTFEEAKSGGTIRWIREIDADRLWKDLAGKLAPKP